VADARDGFFWLPEREFIRYIEIAGVLRRQTAAISFFPEATQLFLTKYV
jgi:hypothetical protein